MIIHTIEKKTSYKMHNNKMLLGRSVLPLNVRKKSTIYIKQLELCGGGCIYFPLIIL